MWFAAEVVNIVKYANDLIMVLRSTLVFQFYSRFMSRYLRVLMRVPVTRVHMPLSDTTLGDMGYRVVHLRLLFLGLYDHPQNRVRCGCGCGRDKLIV